MKKLMLGLMLLIAIFSFAQVPNAALLHTKTGHPDPAFVLFITPTWVGVGDYVGVYRADTLLCYGARVRATDTNNIVAMPCHLDDPTSKNIDGFKYENVITPFYYSKAEDKFYQLTSRAFKYADVETKSEKIDGKRIVSIVKGSPIASTNVKAYPIAVYIMDSLIKGDEIVLLTDTELEKVKLEFIQNVVVVKTGGLTKIPLSITIKNVSNVQYIINKGTGKIVTGRTKEKFYQFTDFDQFVIIDVVGVNFFTKAILTDRININIDASPSANAKYEDNNLIVYLKKDKVNLYVKAEKVAVSIYRFENGIKKMVYKSGQIVQGFDKSFINRNYNLQWKGQKITIEYLYYIDGVVVKGNDGKPKIITKEIVL